MSMYWTAERATISSVMTQITEMVELFFQKFKTVMAVVRFHEHIVHLICAYFLTVKVINGLDKNLLCNHEGNTGITEFYVW